MTDESANESRRNMNESDFRLFYEEDRAAYFTDGDLDDPKIVADDWNKSRRQALLHDVEDGEWIRVEIGGPFKSANNDHPPKGILNGRMALLKTEPWNDSPTEIRAGMTLGDVIVSVEQAGGDVYLPASVVWNDD